MKSEINILVSSLGGGGAEKVAINLANNQYYTRTVYPDIGYLKLFFST